VQSPAPLDFEAKNALGIITRPWWAGRRDGSPSLRGGGRKFPDQSPPLAEERARVRGLEC